jgi:prophage regulatory protein
MDRIMRRREVETVTGLSRSTIYDRMAREQFPRPVPIGARAVGWRESEIRAWLDARDAERARGPREPDASELARREGHRRRLEERRRGPRAPAGGSSRSAAPAPA